MPPRLGLPAPVVADPHASIRIVAGGGSPRYRRNRSRENRCRSRTWPACSETATSNTAFATSTAIVVEFIGAPPSQGALGRKATLAHDAVHVAGGVHSITRAARREPVAARHNRSRRPLSAEAFGSLSSTRANRISLMCEPDCSACPRLPVLFLLARGAASSRPRAACQR